MEIKLVNLRIENFRSTTGRQAEFAGRNARVSGETESGKTTLADAWSWLWNGRDSAGKTGRGMRPVYRSGPKKDQPIRGLTSVVEATLLIAAADDPGMNGTFVLRKEEAEKATGCEGEIEYSYPKKHSINGDYVLEKAFKEWIAQIEDPDIIRALTDTDFFLADEKKGGMHHTERRKLLRAMGGDIGRPEGFDDVESAITGRTFDGYKKELSDQKAKDEKELDAVPGLIGENQRMMGEYKQGDSVDELDAKREIEIETLVGIGQERATFLKQEQSREDAKEKVSNLHADKIKREAFLANDTSATEGLQTEAAGLAAAASQQRTALTELQGNVSVLSAKDRGVQGELAALMRNRENFRKTWERLNVPPPKPCPSGPECPFIEQAKEETENRENLLVETRKLGETVHAAIKAKESGRITLQDEFQEAEQKRLAARSAFLSDNEDRCKRLAEIDGEIKNCPHTKPDKDEIWNRIVAAMRVIEKDIGEPVADQLAKLEARKQIAESEKQRLDKALKDADNANECIDRIAELEARQKELAQMITTASGKLHRVQLYQRAESELISNAVNMRFKGVEFRLFKERLNGEIEPCCDALDDGVTYAEMSGGQKIRASVGAIEALSTYYKLWMPLFIDNRQDLTEPLALPMQTIELYAVEGVKELRVEFQEGKGKKG